MANFLVLLEAHQGTLLPVSLEVLGQGRRIATELGATLYALLPLPDTPTYGEGDLINIASHHGADKVVLLSSEALSREPEQEMRFGSHGSAVLAACEHFPPTILLLGATLGARDLAPRVAARLGAVFQAEGWVDVADGHLRLCDGQGRVLFGPGAPSENELEHPIVLTIATGRATCFVGGDEAEMTIVAASGIVREEFVAIGSESGPYAAVIETMPEQGLRTWALNELGANKVQDGCLAPSLVFCQGAPPAAMPGAVFVAMDGEPGDSAAHYALSKTARGEA